MILFDSDLFDSDLDPKAAPSGSRQKLPAAAARTDRLPSLRLLNEFLRQAQSAVRLRGQVSVLLTGDDTMRRLNRRFRGKNKTTDVLSFPAEPGPENIAGDLAIGVPTARQQAAGYGHRLGIEIKVLMLHGLLHLAGYDHETDSGEMARREQKLRARLGLPLGLIERAEKPSRKPATDPSTAAARTASAHHDGARVQTRTRRSRTP